MSDAFPAYVVIWIFVVAWGTFFAMLALWALKTWRKRGFGISLTGVLIVIAVVAVVILLGMYAD